MIEQKLRELSQDDSLIFVCAPEYSSSHPNYRERIRQMIAAELEVETDSLASVLDLSKPLLSVDDAYVSISHCPAQGGFALSRKPIGFDVEAKGRVRTAAVLRIAKQNELDGAPSTDTLWAAKEAAFKALQHAEKKPELLSQIEISDWKWEPGLPLPAPLCREICRDFSSRGALGCFIIAGEFVVCTFTLSA